MEVVKKTIGILLTTFFLGGIFLCVGIASSMHHDMSVGTPCPMTTANDGCSAPTDHISYWANILLAIPSDFAALVLALVAACACVWIVCRGIWDSPKLFSSFQYPIPPPLTFFLPRHTLQEAFSNGILHPKLY